MAERETVGKFGRHVEVLRLVLLADLEQLGPDGSLVLLVHALVYLVHTAEGHLGELLERHHVHGGGD